LADTGCAALINCLLVSTGKCNGDVACFALACQSYIGGASAPLELEILQNCGSFIGL